MARRFVPLSALALVAVAVVGAGAGCIVGNVAASPIDQQRSIARKLEPESLQPAARRHVEERGALRVRAYVDEAYASAFVDFEKRVHATVDDASRILHGQLGVTLSLVEIRHWSSAQPDLVPSLETLRALDDGADVDIVVGFIGAMPVVTDQLHQLGRAYVLGRHAVVRAMNDAAEARAIDRLLNRMPESERDELVLRRRRHKAAIVLLHEVAHVLGGVHVADHEVVLFPRYSIDQNVFDEDTLALLELGVAHRRATTRADRAQLAARLRDEIERRRDRLDRADLDEHLALLESQRAADAGDVSRDTGQLVLRPEELSAYNTAVVALQRDDARGAFAAVAPVVERAGAGDEVHPKLLELACLLASGDGVVAMNGKALCQRALAAAPAALGPALGAARLAKRHGRAADVDGALDEARRRLTPADAPNERLDLARLAAAGDRLTLAEDALSALASLEGHEGAAHLREQITARRRRSGLPRGALADDHDEPRVLAALSSAYATLDKPGKDALAAAQAQLDEAEQRFGGVVGLKIARCDVLRRRKQVREAETMCREAVARFDEASFGHVMLGIVLVERRRLADAVAHLERGLELDPAHPPTWRVLRSVLAGTGQRQRADELDERHRARFGKPIER